MKGCFELAIYNRLTNGGEIAAEVPASTPEMDKSTYQNNRRNDYYQEEYLDKKTTSTRMKNC